MALIEYKHMVLGPASCPVFHRWRVKIARSFSVSLHHFLSDGSPELQHDHPWWFITLILRGSYLDVGPHGVELMKAGRVAFRPAHHRHATVAAKGCWTLVLNGPIVRENHAWNGENPISGEELEELEGRLCDA